MTIVGNLYNVIANEEKEYRYSYRLLSEELFGGQAFGIEIERQDIVDGNVITIERDQIRKISNKEDKVKKLLKLAYENQVSPIHMIDVLGKYVDEYVVDFNF